MARIAGRWCRPGSLGAGSWPATRSEPARPRLCQLCPDNAKLGSRALVWQKRCRCWHLAKCSLYVLQCAALDSCPFAGVWLLSLLLPTSAKLELSSGTSVIQLLRMNPCSIPEQKSAWASSINPIRISTLVSVCVFTCIWGQFNTPAV